MKLHVKTGDTVRIISGSYRGTVATIVRTNPSKGLVYIEGLGIRKRHVKPSQLNPRGGTKEIHTGIDSSNVVKVEPEQKSEVAKKPKAAKKGESKS